MDKWINDFGYELLDGVFMDETMSVYEDASLKQLYFDSIEYIRKELTDIRLSVNLRQIYGRSFVWQSGIPWQKNKIHWWRQGRTYCWKCWTGSFR